MNRINMPFAGLIAQLIKLNEDREQQYHFFSIVCYNQKIREICDKLSRESTANLEELNRLVIISPRYWKLCPPFTVSSVSWKELNAAKDLPDSNFAVIIINRIESRFAALYQSLFSSFPGDQEDAAAIIRSQYRELLKSKSTITHLFMHLN